MRILDNARLNRELRIVARHEARQKRLCCSHICDAGKPHLLDQTILQRLVRALDAALRLRRPCADLLDAEPPRHTAELGQPIAAVDLLRIDPENAVTVRVQRKRNAMRQDVRAQRVSVGPRRLGGRKQQARQTTRGIIDEHDQRHLRAAPFEPVVHSAVDLDQLAEPGAPFPKLKHALLAAFARDAARAASVSAEPSPSRPRSPSCSASFSAANVAPKSAYRSRSAASIRAIFDGSNWLFDGLPRLPETSPRSPRRRNAATSRFTWRTPQPQQLRLPAPASASPATTRRITAADRAPSRSSRSCPRPRITPAPHARTRGHFYFAQRGHLNSHVRTMDGLAIPPISKAQPPDGAAQFHVRQRKSSSRAASSGCAPSMACG